MTVSPSDVKKVHTYCYVMSDRGDRVYSMNKGWRQLLLIFRDTLVICSLLITVSSLYGQDLTIRETEDALKDLYGVEKLEALNRLTDFYRITNLRKAMRYGKQAVSVGEHLLIESDTGTVAPNLGPLIAAYVHLGKVHYDREDYFPSQEQFLSAKSLATEYGDQTYDQEINQYLQEIEDLAARGKVKQSFLSKTIGELKVGELVNNASRDLAVQADMKLGLASERKGEFRKAIDHYQRAVERLRDTGDKEEVNSLQLKIAVLLDRIDQHEEAKEFLDKAISEMEKDPVLTMPTHELDTISLEPQRPQVERQKSDVSVQLEKKNLKDLADSYALEKDFEKSLAYYKLYQELSEKVETDSIQRILEKGQRTKEILLLKQQKRIADLNIEAIELENEKQIRLRNRSRLVALVILIGTLVAIYLYLQKRREHKRLTIAYRDLNKTKGKLVNAEQKIFRLLRQQVSGDCPRTAFRGFNEGWGTPFCLHHVSRH